MVVAGLTRGSSCSRPESSISPAPPLGGVGPWLVWSEARVVKPDCPSVAGEVVLSRDQFHHNRGTSGRCECARTSPPSSMTPTSFRARASSRSCNSPLALQDLDAAADLLVRSDHRSVEALENDIREWVQTWNEKPKPFIWTKTADQILTSFGRLLQRTTDAGH